MSLSPLWLAPSYPCEADIYAAIWLRTQARALKNIDIIPNIIAPVPWVPPGFNFFSSRWDRYIGAPYRENDDGIAVFRPRYFSHPKEHNFGAPHTMQLIRLLCANIKKPPLIHAYFALQQGWVGLQLARRWKVPLVVSLLGDDVNVYPHFSAGDMKRFREVIAGADVVIAQGTALEDATHQMTERRPRTIPLGINVSTFARQNTQAQARTALNLPQDKAIALFVGSLVDHKGVPELLRVLESLSDKNLFGVFVGEGPLRGEIENTSNAIAVGSQDQRGVQNYLEAADLAVLPSHREGLPMTLVEAGAMGLPIVAYDVGSIGDLIGEGRGWLVRSRDEAALADAVEQVITNQGEASSRADKLHSYVLENFSDTSYAKSVSEIYHALLA